MNQCTYRIGCMSKDKLLPKNLEAMIKVGEFKHEVRQFEKSYDNQQAEQISLMV